jgi:hypothetical protein
VVVAVFFELRRWFEPVEVATELFDGIERADDGETSFVFCAFRGMGCGEGRFTGARRSAG